MTRKTRLSDDLLDDSEATLRLVDSLLEDLREGEDFVKDVSERGLDEVAEPVAPSSVLSQLPAVLLRAHSEIKVALDTLRRSRGVLERATVERIKRTHQNLREITSTTEKAATDMLDGLDRALLLIDRLDSSSEPVLTEAASEAAAQDAGLIRTELRDELFHLIGSLQFQDITSQQLRYASGVLEEIEERLDEIAELFDLGLAELGGPAADAASEPGSSRVGDCDPSASMDQAEERQAVADEIFMMPKAK